MTQQPKPKKSPPTELGRRILAALQAKGWTQAQLADELDVRAPTVNKLIQSDSVPTAETLHRLANALGVPPVRFLSALPPAPFVMPLLGWIPAGKPASVADAAGETDFRTLFATGTFTLDVRGESMQGAGVFDNDVVVVREAQAADDGDIVVAVVNGERTLKLMGKDSHGRAALLPFNESFAPILLNDGDDVRIEGVVIGGAWSTKRRRWRPKPTKEAKAGKGKKK